MFLFEWSYNFLYTLVLYRRYLGIFQKTFQTEILCIRSDNCNLWSMKFVWLINMFIRCDLNFLNVHYGFKPKDIYNQKGKCNISFGFKWHLYLHGIWGVHSRFEFKVEHSSDFDNWSKMDHIFFPKWSTELVI